MKYFESLIDSSQSIERYIVNKKTLNNCYSSLQEDNSFSIKKRNLILKYFNLKCKFNECDEIFGIVEKLITLGWTPTDIFFNNCYYMWVKNPSMFSYMRFKQDSIFIIENKNLTNLPLAIMLREMMFSDQSIRQEIISATNDKDSFKIIETHERWYDIEFYNRLKLIEIIRKYGIPKLSEIGSDGQFNFNLLFIHQDLDFFMTHLNKLYQSSKSGDYQQNIEPIIDKALFLKSNKTIYGTGWNTENRIKDSTEIKKRLREINIDM